MRDYPNLLNNQQGQKWFTHFRGQWMIISYVWVLETNTGATWRVGYLRLARFDADIWFAPN